ncbi:hypothetical protein DSO57_1006647 [Entomophthora muscae]|uniref:Uncharacterized protein n=1 Tax=Entomophthora muscae TaxID=34485 RepID=A0ACC2U6Z9_9FUNG|nr:hypothetical protein DSO57_1006647 [Entomophthora muscae]
MEERNDLQHMQELCLFYHPHTTLPALIGKDSHFTPSPCTPMPKLKLLPYKCCGEIFYGHKQTLEHYFLYHILHIKTYVDSLKLPPFSKRVIVDKNIPIFVRVQTFLNAFKTPKNPKQFRPTPHSRDPREFTNPYSVVMALAYDFIDVVVHEAEEYSRFVAMLGNYHPTSSYRQVWIYWAFYLFPIPSKPNIHKEPPLIQGQISLQSMLPCMLQMLVPLLRPILQNSNQLKYPYYQFPFNTLL